MTGTEVGHANDPPAPVPIAPDHIGQALAAGVDVAVIERLVALQERTEDRHATAAFNRAMHDFQALTHAIQKNRLVSFATRSGGEKTYPFADLAQIAEDIRGPLADVGLSYSWDVRGDDCFCIVAHVDGHSVERSHPIHNPETKGTNKPQNYAAGVQYAKRYSLTNALGIVTADPDTDGAEAKGTPITREQRATLAEHIATAAEEVGADAAKVERRFLRLLAVSRLEDLDASRYEFALAKIQERKE